MEFWLLSFLENGEKTGGELLEAFESQTGKALPIGTLYTTLKRMNERDWTGEPTVDKNDGRRRLFSIRAKGRTALKAARDRYQDLADYRFGISGRIA